MDPTTGKGTTGKKQLLGEGELASLMKKLHNWLFKNQVGTLTRLSKLDTHDRECLCVSLCICV